VILRCGRGLESPFSFFPTDMELEQKIADKVNELLEDDSHFLVEVSLSSNRIGTKLLILLDGDEGISIESCARVSRKVGRWIEEEELIENSYQLEVSSPGLDKPLQSLRQYKKNIGRMVKMTDPTDITRKGLLMDVSEEGIRIEEEVKQEGKKKTVKQEVFIPFVEIKKCTVLVSFK
jgi:ribosome maturation factor RimP